MSQIHCKANGHLPCAPPNGAAAGRGNTLNHDRLCGPVCGWTRGHAVKRGDLSRRPFTNTRALVGRLHPQRETTVGNYL